MANTRQDQTSKTDQQPSGAGRVLALDLGAKRVGVAVSDELRMTARPLAPLRRGNWKKLLQAVSHIIEEFDARVLVIGLPLRLNGTEGEAARAARQTAKKFRLSLPFPVYLYDERLTTFAAKESLRASRRNRHELAALVDSESAAIILRDFMAHRQP